MYKKYYWLNEESKDMLERGYLLPGQTVSEKLNKITTHIANVLKRPDLQPRFLEVFENGWASLSSPIWANVGEDRALGISCFNSHCPDNLEGIYDTLKEVAMMTKEGGGTSGYFGGLRAKGEPVTGGGTSSGVVSFISLFDATVREVAQAGVRRGAFAAYLDIDHPEIMEFLRIKDRDSSMQTINTAVNVTDAWMESMIAGDAQKRVVWARVLQSRRDKGIPYIHFIDNVNNNAPQVYKDKGLKINSSNLCSEIELASSEDESFVCCLLSMNLLHFDTWRHTDAVELMMYFLDGVMTDFIQRAKKFPGFERAVRFAERQRAVGLGVLGYHSYLKSKMIPFESIEASQVNNMIFKYLDDETLKATKKLAVEYGEPELLIGYGIRNATRLALAPTTSSSSILGGVSPSFELSKSNYYTVGLAKGSFSRKDQFLIPVLQEKGKDTDEVWESILLNKGSVQHLDFLSDLEKAVFKTSEEVSPAVVIQQAAARQKYIDQGQSLNLLIPNEVSIKQINEWIIDAWSLGIKALYYQRGTSVAKDKVLEMLECQSCSA